MNKELFIDIVNKVEELYHSQEKYSKIFKEIDPEFGGAFIYTKPIEYIIGWLKTLVDDKYDDISYYMWELDFGAKYTDGTVTDEDGTIIPLANASDLYDLIQSNK